nr:MAG TPA: Tail associated lysozyme [Caudoviricetes sp.]
MTFDDWLISRLRYHGVYSGAADGAHGRVVIEALKAFQKKMGLTVTGTATDATVLNLRKSNAAGSSTIIEVGSPKPIEPVWMREARRFMGLKEIAGPKSNPTIMGWAKKLGGWIANFYTDDDIPWCGLAVAHWIGATLPKEALPSNPLSALAWGKFGRSLSTASLGAILVFKRTGGGHVGLYVGEDATHYHVLGGNQQNSVSITRIEKGRLEDMRWPSTAPAPQSGRVMLTASGAVSHNEA